MLIVDDHALVRRGLRWLLSDEFKEGAFGEAGDARQALTQLRKKEWDVALIDISLPGKSGLDLLKEMKAEWPNLPVLVLSGHAEDQFAMRVLKAGASGYLSKDSPPDELVKAVRKIVTGGRYVSPALAETLASWANGIWRARRTRRSRTASYEVMSRIAVGKSVTEIAGRTVAERENDQHLSHADPREARRQEQRGNRALRDAKRPRGLDVAPAFCLSDKLLQIFQPGPTENHAVTDRQDPRAGLILQLRNTPA